MVQGELSSISPPTFHACINLVDNSPCSLFTVAFLNRFSFQLVNSRLCGDCSIQSAVKNELLVTKYAFRVALNKLFFSTSSLGAKDGIKAINSMSLRQTSILMPDRCRSSSILSILFFISGRFSGVISLICL